MASKRMKMDTTWMKDVCASYLQRLLGWNAYVFEWLTVRNEEWCTILCKWYDKGDSEGVCFFLHVMDTTHGWMASMILARPHHLMWCTSRSTTHMSTTMDTFDWNIVLDGKHNSCSRCRSMCITKWRLASWWCDHKVYNMESILVHCSSTNKHLCSLTLMTMHLHYQGKKEGWCIYWVTGSSFSCVSVIYLPTTCVVYHDTCGSWEAFAIHSWMKLEDW